MNKKKILIISRSFYPESSPRAFRTTELVKEFARQGHDVTLLTNERDYDYTDFKTQFPVKIEFFGPLKWKQPIPAKFAKVRQKVGRLLFLLFEYPNIEIMYRVRKALKNYNGFDLLISIAVPHPTHWGVAQARSKSHPIAKCWVADCGDHFMGNTLESIPPPFYFSYFERQFCSKADYISVPTEGAIQAYYKEYRDKIVVIPQGFNFDEFNVVKQQPANPVPSFAYAGALGAAGIRNPINLIKYLLSTNRDFQFHIFSKNAAFLKNLSNSWPDKIILHEPLPRGILLNELAKMDFLLNFDNGSKNQTPSKLIDYALADRPVLNILADNPDTSLVDRFLAGDYAGKLHLPNLEQYRIANVTEQFLNLIPN